MAPDALEPGACEGSTMLGVTLDGAELEAEATPPPGANDPAPLAMGTPMLMVALVAPG